MSNPFSVGIAAVAALVLSTSAGLGADQTRVAAASEVVGEKTQAVQTDTASKAASALSVAADLGDIDSQLKLARMHELGDGVEANQLKAFKLYQRIIDDHDDVRPHHAKAEKVAKAFIALSGYYKTGVPGSTVQANKKHAAALLWHAASYLGDAEAQYLLSKAYLEGEGVPQNPRLAVNWLLNASKKRHAKSQALLGKILWGGSKDIRRQPLKGLAFLSLAQQNASGTPEARWIDDLYVNLWTESRADERDGAAKLAKRWQKRMGRPDMAIEPPVKFEVKAKVEDTGAAPETKPGVAGFTNVGLDGSASVR